MQHALSSYETDSMQVPVVICDYQLEVNLNSYNNSERRLEVGTCCDLENNGFCFPQDTCDVRFTFQVTNLHTLTMFYSQTKVFGPYENTDMITFPNCSILISNVGNPLTFIIPSNRWNAGVSLFFRTSFKVAYFHCLFFLETAFVYMQEVLRLQASIADADQDPVTGRPVQQFILSTSSGTIADIRRPSAPNATFTNIRTFNGPNSLTLTYQYRIICTAGTCGSDCSQTTNCLPFPSCTPLTCADSPCQNGGTCTDVSDIHRYSHNINFILRIGKLLCLHMH